MKRGIKAGRVLWEIATPFISAFLGLMLVDVFDLFALFPLPEGVSSYEICMTVYFAAFDVVLSYISKQIRKSIVQQKINAILSLSGNAPSVTANPTIILSGEKIAEMNLTVSVSAKKSTCKNVSIRIAAPNFVTIQLPRVHKGIFVDENGIFWLEISSLFGQQDFVNTRQEFRILLVREPVDGMCTAEIRPELVKENIFIEYACNKAELKAEG